MAKNPFEGNSSENRLLYILEKDNVNFSRIMNEGPNEYTLVAERGMSGGKIITILRQQAADEVDIATADLDFIRSEYSIGTYLMVPPLASRVEMQGSFEEEVWYRTDGNRWTIYPIDYPWVEIRTPLRCFTMGQSYYYDGRNGYMVGPTYDEYGCKSFLVEEEDGKLTWSTNDVEYAEAMGDSEYIRDREYYITERSFTNVNEDGSTTIVEQAGVNKDLFAISSYPENKTKDVYLALGRIAPGVETPNNQGDNMADTVYLAKIVKELSDSDEFQVWNIDGTTLKTYNGGFFIALFNPDVTIETIDNTVNDMLNSTDVTIAVSDGLIGFFYVSQDKTEMFNTLAPDEEYDENLGTSVNVYRIDYATAYLPTGANPPSATLDFENNTFTIQAPYSLGSPWVMDPDNPDAAIGTTFTFKFATPDNGTTNPDTVQDIMPTYVVISTSLLDELALTIQSSYSITNSITIGDMIDIIKGTYTPPEDMSGGE